MNELKTSGACQLHVRTRIDGTELLNGSQKMADNDGADRVVRSSAYGFVHNLFSNMSKVESTSRRGRNSAY